MMHPHTELVHVNATVGLGVIATRPIPAGTLVWVRDPVDQQFTETQVAAMPAMLRHTFRRHAYRTTDVSWTLSWDNARFVNHSCNYNCVGFGDGLEIAWRHIDAGEQLTNDYSVFYLETDEEFDCACGADRCRARVESVSVEDHRSAYEAAVARGIAQLRQASDQQLWPLLADDQIVMLRDRRRAIADESVPRRTRRRHVRRASRVLSSLGSSCDQLASG